MTATSLELLGQPEKKTTYEKASVSQVLEVTLLKSWSWEDISLSTSSMYKSGETHPNAEITS